MHMLKSPGVGYFELTDPLEEVKRNNRARRYGGPWIRSNCFRQQTYLLKMPAQRRCMPFRLAEWRRPNQPTFTSIIPVSMNMPKYSPERALELLRIGSGNPNASFREGQEEAISHVVEGRGRLLVVQKTGWGKSFVYFIAARMLRDADTGPAVLFSPLLSLMRNQIEAATRMGLRAVTMNSDNQDEWEDVETKLKQNTVDILLISPERLGNRKFVENVMSVVAPRISMLVVDEAHCVSDWGHDFRPHYRLIDRMVRSLPENLRLLATTATANQRVMDDLANLMPGLTVMRGDLNRSSITLQTIRLAGRASRMAWLLEQLRSLAGSGIVYVLTRKDAEQLSNWLILNGIKAAPYMGGDSGNRDKETLLLRNQIKALVATTALGMGFDKPDLAFVIHFQSPASVVAYYQQVGRAGRAIKSAYGILLSGKEDDNINDFFIDNAFPDRDQVAEILSVLAEAPDGLSIHDLQNRVNQTQRQLERTLQLLTIELPAPLVKEGSKYRLTAAPLSEDFWDTVDRLTTLRREEQAQMQEYLDLPFGEHMPYLIRALDGDVSVISRPVLPPLPAEVQDKSVIRSAVDFLKESNLELKPKARWPSGSGVSAAMGPLNATVQCAPGRALAWWGEDGWGADVKHGKYTAGHFSDELVQAAVDLILHRWNPDPQPTWVTWIPSARHPDLVPDFAKRLANSLGLSAVETLTQTTVRPEQKTMLNACQQVRNLIDGLTLPREIVIPEGPVLLVDDMVDSGWTFAIAGRLLRLQGCPSVFPFALAMAGTQSDD